MKNEEYYIEVLQDYLNGYAIEKNKRYSSGYWSRTLNPEWDFNYFNYRVKRRPYTYKELECLFVKNGRTILYREGEYPELIKMRVVGLNEFGIDVTDGKKRLSFNFEQLLKSFFWEKNGEPCGVKMKVNELK